MDSLAACRGVIRDKARDFRRACCGCGCCCCCCCWGAADAPKMGKATGDTGDVVASLVAGRLDDREGRPKGILVMERWRRNEGRRSLVGEGSASLRLAW